MKPLRAINRTGVGSARAVKLKDWVTGKAEDKVEWANMIVLQRLAIGQPLTKIFEDGYIKNKPVVVDLDDAYKIIPRQYLSHKFWIDGIVPGPGGRAIKSVIPPTKQLDWGVKLAGAITSPSQVILDDWREYVDRRILVPNYVEVNRYSQHQKKDMSGPITIGWGGSATHGLSFEASKASMALKRVLDERRDVRLVIAGGSEAIIRGLVTRNNVKQISVVPWDKPTNWPRTLGTFDIGIAPMDTHYDARRSWIKILEYGCMGIPWVASRNLMSENYASMGSLVRDRTGEWVDALLDIIDNYDSKKRDAMEKNYTWAMEQDIDLRAQDIIDAWHEAAFGF